VMRKNKNRSQERMITRMINEITTLIRINATIEITEIQIEIIKRTISEMIKETTIKMRMMKSSTL
jgi:hypothetical protein